MHQTGVSVRLTPIELWWGSWLDGGMQKRTAEEVERLLNGYEQSGLSRQEYCQGEGIPVTTFDYYRQRSTRKAAAQRRAAASGLVKVKLEAAPIQAQSVFSLVLANGRRIESGWSFSEADLARLIRIAEAV
jgi:hypothetical protein